MAKFTTTEITVLTVVCIVLAIFLALMAMYAIKLRRSASYNSVKTRKYTPKINTVQIANWILTDEHFDEYLSQWAYKYGLDDLAEYLKAYYVLNELYQAMCAKDIKQFFVNGTLGKNGHCKDYLMDACSLLGNQTLTQLCEQALALEEKYNISTDKTLPEERTEALARLNKNLRRFDAKYHMKQLLHDFFGKHYVANSDALGIVIQPTYYQRFAESDNASTDYDIYNKWCADSYRVHDTAMKSNSTLYGAYIAMCYHNEVCNGGIDQFWDYAEDDNWDLDEIARLFETLLPKDMYKLYLKAVQMHRAGQDCEELNRQYDYDKMSKEVLPQLATKVGDYYRQKASK